MQNYVNQDLTIESAQQHKNALRPPLERREALNLIDAPATCPELIDYLKV
jgi:hypothetical protein